MRLKPCLLAGLAALTLAGCQYKGIAAPQLSARDSEYMALVPHFEHYVDMLPWEVSDPTGEPAGTIVVETKDRHLYYTLGNGRAIRYGVAVGNEAFGWTGTATIQRKAEWPSWTPGNEARRMAPGLPATRLAALPCPSARNAR